MLVIKFTNMSEEDIDEFHPCIGKVQYTVTCTSECKYEVLIITNKNIGEFFSFLIKEAYYIVDTESWGFLINKTGIPVATDEFKEEILTYIMINSNFN